MLVGILYVFRLPIFSLCGFKTGLNLLIFLLKLHMETRHPEDDGVSPFVVQAGSATSAVHNAIESLKQSPEPTRDHAASGDEFEDEHRVADVAEESDFVYCPVEGCGEALLLTDLEGHVEMHGEEGDFTPSPEPEDRHGNDNVAPTHYSQQQQGRSTRDKRVKLDPEYRGKPGIKTEGFGTKLAYALRNLEDVDLEVHEQKERGERKGQNQSQGAKSAWGRILKMPEQKIGTNRRSKSPTRGSAGPSSKKSVTVRRLGVSRKVQPKFRNEGVERL